MLYFALSLLWNSRIIKNLPMTTDPAVDAWFAELNHPLKAEMQAVREIILNAHPDIAERVKWKSASFYYRPNPKLDLGAVHWRAQDCVHLVLVFHSGAMLPDRYDGLLEGDYKDRRMARFFSAKDIRLKQTILHAVVNDWVALIQTTHH
jgi:hypothetical protein